MAVEALDRRNPIASVIVCTRNRRDNPVATVEAVLNGSCADLEILLVDQSDNDATREAIAPLQRQDDRLRYLRLGRAGKPNALNAARREAGGRCLLLTDDDCEPAPDWAAAMTEALADPQTGCVFGGVTAAPHPSDEGYITTYEVAGSCVVRLRDIYRMPGRNTSGMGACLGLQRAAIDRIGGWDPCIGPGSLFWGGDDHDIAMRLDLAGYAIGFSADARVTHYGFRRWPEERNDHMRCGYGRGAAWMKYLRLGILHREAANLYRLQRQATLDPARQKEEGPRAFVEYFRRGARAALWHPIDRRTRCFRPVSAAVSRKYGDVFANVVLRSQQRSTEALRLD